MKKSKRAATGRGDTSGNCALSRLSHLSADVAVRREQRRGQRHRLGMRKSLKCPLVVVLVVVVVVVIGLLRCKVEARQTTSGVCHTRAQTHALSLSPSLPLSLSPSFSYSQLTYSLYILISDD